MSTTEQPVLTISRDIKEPTWVQRYRPQSIDECCIPQRLKNQLRLLEDPSNPLMPMTLSGRPGCGKTTAARAIVAKRDMTMLFINASKDGGIGTLRDDVLSFAFRRGLGTGGGDDVRRVVVLDEADALEPKFQEALRGTIEELSNHCSFILTCNHPQKLTQAIQSRAPIVDFNMTKEECLKCGGQFLKRCEEILRIEGVEFDRQVLAKLIMRMSPDFRKTLMIIQHYCGATKKLDDGILAKFDVDVAFDELADLLKAKNVWNLREWVKRHSNLHLENIYRLCYDNFADKVTNDGLIVLILRTEEYKAKHPMVADPEISITAYLTHLSHQLQWK